MLRTRKVGTWAPDGEDLVPHAEVILRASRPEHEAPDGAIQMHWTDEHGYRRGAHVVRWWRLDRQGLAPGVPVEVDVQARQRRDLSCPPHHVSASLVVTGSPADKAQVMIGDPVREGSWAYGVLFHGAVLTGTSVLVDEA